MPPAQPPAPNPQAIQDAEHIKLLAIFHYVYAGLVALGASIPIIHVAMGFAMVSGAIPMSSGTPPSSGGAVPPDASWMGWFFVIIGGSVIIVGWTFAVLVFFAGKFLSERRRYTFVFVIACINCINVPMGTALGIFTILVMQRPSVKELFDGPALGSGS
ncbi:hypothetical protein HAHE_23680 [Haloferula helveola]|uniref:Uncharacterized protein n=1 Tax=Haloferula helveola TaxID=490095 RepID=A0ABM7REF2_9BACT|nr:hypothetical protein HAHE_23680 [Haloferula helveola]